MAYYVVPSPCPRGDLSSKAGRVAPAACWGLGACAVLLVLGVARLWAGAGGERRSEYGGV
jgi:hypothetical protein